MRHVPYWPWLISALIVFARGGAAAERDASDFFERRVRPILSERCHKCHAGALAKGGLRLDSAEGLQAGGESGQVVVAGQPQASLLMQAVRHQNGLKMPPDGMLTALQLADLAKWIEEGAIWPAGAARLTGAAAAVPAQPRAPNHGELAESLQLWLRADRLLLGDQQPVAVWPDQSGRGRDVSATYGVRADGVGKPGTYIAASRLSHRPAVRFEPSTGLASSPDLPVPIRGDAALTIVLAMYLEPHTAEPPYDGVLGLGNPAHSGDPGKPLAALVQISRRDNHALQFAGGWNHDATLGTGSFLPFYDRPLIVSMTKQPGPMRTTTQIHINGQRMLPQDRDTLAGSDAVPDFQHRADIGVYLGKAVSWAGSIQGDLGEVLVYNKALSDLERSGVEAHLADKFGLTLDSEPRPVQVWSEAERSFWAYQPVRDPVAPEAADSNWNRSPLDRFLYAQFAPHGLTPAPPAERRAWLRRVTYDLTGLPPTPAEMDVYLNDRSAEADASVVDRLLASPHYGEHWARHWLDVVRYAETTANDANAVMRYAWRYRNYVIESFQNDLPYNQFILEQLAGDMLPAEESAAARADQIIATGFLMIGPKALAETDKEQSRLDIIDDQIDVIGRTFLGLTIACARCHDHKFDAIGTADYYALAGILRSTEPFQDEARNATMWWEYPVPAAEAEPLMVMAPKELPPRQLRIHVRGNRFELGPSVPRGVVQIVDESFASESADRIGPEGVPFDRGGRLALARWIASPHNPLTARVMANRIWQRHFGTGLVATSDNFGTRGELPSHPELLDWLASRLIDSGWSVKSLHRQIVLSTAYRQSCTADENARTLDPDNRWLARFARRRLSAEELRDSVLAVSGQLDRTPGGNESGEFLFSQAEDIGVSIRPNRVSADHEFYHTFTKRSVYLPVVRNMLPDVLALFDAADPNGVTAVRNETTVPAQALFLLNSPFVRAQAAHFARRLLAESHTTAQRVEEAHRLAFGRSATATEIERAERYLTEYAASLPAAAGTEEERLLAAWQSYCQSLFCANEFMYLE